MLSLPLPIMLKCCFLKKAVHTLKLLLTLEKRFNSKCHKISKSNGISETGKRENERIRWVSVLHIMSIMRPSDQFQQRAHRSLSVQVATSLCKVQCWVSARPSTRWASMNKLANNIKHDHKHRQTQTDSTDWRVAKQHKSAHWKMCALVKKSKNKKKMRYEAMSFSGDVHRWCMSVCVCLCCHSIASPERFKI